MKYIAHPEVDIDMLKEIREENGGEDESVEEMISSEMGWVEESGISVVDIKKKTEEN